MDIRSELILRAISAFQKEQVAEFTYQMLEDVCNREFVRGELKKLEQDDVIEKLNKNGFSFKFKLNTILDCPEFIFNKTISVKNKQLLLELFNTPTEYYSITEMKEIWKCGDSTAYTRKRRIENEINESIDNFLSNQKIITKNFESNYEIIDTKCGKQFKTKNRTLDYKCKFCGDDDPNNFYENSHSICKSCQVKNKKEQRKNRMSDIITCLYTHGKRSKTAENKGGFQLSKQDIEDILEKQNYKCYYTGIEFDRILDDTNKLTHPTLDRIDSSKGYTKENVVICTWWSNISKNDLSKEDFIEMCKKVANNFTFPEQ